MKRRIYLVLIDIICILLIGFTTLSVYPSSTDKLSTTAFLVQLSLAVICLIGTRLCFKIYNQVWRYANTRVYMRLMISDFVAGVIYWFINSIMAVGLKITFVHTVFMIALILLTTLMSRFLYQSIRTYFNNRMNVEPSEIGGIIAKIFPNHLKQDVYTGNKSKVKIAIVGAGYVGTALVDDILCNPNSNYLPVCFVDNNKDKAGRKIREIPIFYEKILTPEMIEQMEVTEVIIAIPNISVEQKKELYRHYSLFGCKVKAYDYPITRFRDDKRQVREFDIEELLFRKPIELNNEASDAFYSDKVILVTGTGSIGSELCRQVAGMKPKQLILLDIYENNAYDTQQQLRRMFGDKLNLAVEIASVRDEKQIRKVFETYRPQVVFHAAAHKHVPLMEHNGSEAIKNNVFGTYNVVRAAEDYGTEKFIMISTDKAVNPTNIMGASKRMCEMIVQSRKHSKTVFSAVRFGNVLGSNGSVIPLFKQQIAIGGPVTITDKRIIRYFMTIPEAAQLVLQAGEMAKDGELFVLDMGNPVKIIDLAENMIKLSGYEPYKDIQIEEIGLRPGEKLYEELLIKTEKLTKTKNEKIFIEVDMPLSPKEVQEKLDLLNEALLTGNNEEMRSAMMKVVPTYHLPEEVNKSASDSEEMKIAITASSALKV